MSELSQEDRAALREVTWKDPERVGGALCFRGTRVPVQNLSDYLKRGHSLDRFMKGFPGVERKQTEQFLDLAVRMGDRLAVPEQEREEETRQPACFRLTKAGGAMRVLIDEHFDVRLYRLFNDYFEVETAQ
jgi:uncharacterized protein (DUF433 family)